MGRESDKQRDSWLLRPKPRTLGDAMQRGARGEPDSGIAPTTGAGPEAGQANWGQLPDLPKWPPLPEEDPFASARPTGLTEETAAITGRTSLSEQQTAPPWYPAASGGYAHPGRPPRTVWQRFRTLSRRSRVGVLVAAASLIVLVCTLASVAALAGGLLNPTVGARNTPAGQTSGQVVAPTAGNTTPTAAASPTSAPTPPSFTITFTCASGSIGGTGQVCVHTLPNAAVSLSVRYCDGSDATGKGLRGSARTDGNGDYTWRWKVTTRCAGPAIATVTAKSSGQTITDRTTFTITR